jgi:hypothetical protein
MQGHYFIGQYNSLFPVGSLLSITAPEWLVHARFGIAAESENVTG